MLQPGELKKPIKFSHGRFVDHHTLRLFFRGFAAGEDKYRLFFWLLLETGMRVKEACAVQERDFENDYQKLNFITCKTPHPSHRTLSPMLARQIKTWCEFNRQRFQYDYIFPSGNPNKYLHMTPLNARQFLARKRKQLRLDKPVRTITSPVGIGIAKSRIFHYYALSNHAFRRFYETNMTDLSNGNYILIASIMQYDEPAIVRKYYDDMKSNQAEKALAKRYHEHIVSGILTDRPMLPREQKRLGAYTEESEPEEVWHAIKRIYNN
ncbi:MAG: tyrosine-type recombinase/integrase [Candidatus Woesearchaeota archaeon]